MPHENLRYLLNNFKKVQGTGAKGSGIILRILQFKNIACETRRHLVREMKINLKNTFLIFLNQRILRATSWYELFAALSNLQYGVLCKVYTFVRRLHVPEKLLCL